VKPTSIQVEFATASLLTALAARHLETSRHSERTSEIALELGRAMNLSGEELYNLKFGALLHDLGKLQTPDAILCKAGRLTNDEWLEMRIHPSTGGAMLRGLGFPDRICTIVEEHHERYDGTGYPFGRRRDEITREARILTVADTFDAITADRCYRPGAPVAAALWEISSWAGEQFDPAVVETLIKLYPVEKRLAA
jgi:putative nucleotidyltransferase with HDIG domain